MNFIQFARDYRLFSFFIVWLAYIADVERRQTLFPYPGEWMKRLEDTATILAGRIE
jgi:hypothetical protein